MLDASIAGAADLFGRIARRFDIAVVGQAQREQGASEELLIEGALFGSGRPVIVVPYIQKERLKLDRVLVCWDGSRPAARAIADAMPFLKRAKAIEIVVVTGERDKSGEITGTNMSAIWRATASTSRSSASPPAASTSPMRSCRMPPTAAPISW